MEIDRDKVEQSLVALLNKSPADNTNTGLLQHCSTVRLTASLLLYSGLSVKFLSSVLTALTA